MKLSATIVTAAALTLTTACAKEKAHISEQYNTMQQFNMFTVRNGKLLNKKVFAPKMRTAGSTATKLVYTLPDGSVFHAKSEIMIKFKKGVRVDIAALEEKYGLKLVRKMRSGDYLFKNEGTDTLKTINTISKEKTSEIERISPNLRLNMKPL
jgi:hypothetical protein